MADFDTFYNMIPIAIFTKDIEGRYTSANTDTLSYWNVNPVGYTDGELLPAELANRLREVDVRVMETGEEHYVEEELLRKDKLCTILSRKTPLRDKDGNIIGILGISIDITARKQVQKQRLELEVEKERVKLLSDFITQVSHEFRTPLSVISTSTYMLEKTDNDPDKRQHYLSKIKKQSCNIDLLINNMLSLVKLRSNQVYMSRVISLNQLLIDAYNMKQSALEYSSINIQFNLSDNPLHIKGDKEYLMLAFEHLLDNAIRYSSQDDSISVHSYIDGNNAIIDIVDSGIGIGNDDLPYIFDSFYRVDKAGTTRGFGLGLSIAKTVFEKFEGYIEVESEVGKGSTFKVSLPLTENVADGDSASQIV